MRTVEIDYRTEKYPSRILDLLPATSAGNTFVCAATTWRRFDTKTYIQKKWERERERERMRSRAGTRGTGQTARPADNLPPWGDIYKLDKSTQRNPRSFPARSPTDASAPLRMAAAQLEKFQPVSGRERERESVCVCVLGGPPSPSRGVCVCVCVCVWVGVCRACVSGRFFELVPTNLGSGHGAWFSFGPWAQPRWHFYGIGSLVWKDPRIIGFQALYLYIYIYIQILKRWFIIFMIFHFIVFISSLIIIKKTQRHHFVRAQMLVLAWASVLEWVCGCVCVLGSHISGCPRWDWRPQLLLSLSLSLPPSLPPFSSVPVEIKLCL